MESQLELHDELIEQREKLREALPGLMAAHDAVQAEVYKDGALSVKVKQLMSLAIALQAGCTPSIIVRAKRAIETGATKEEVLETIAVAVAMGGITNIAESLRVIKLMEEMEKQKPK